MATDLSWLRFWCESLCVCVCVLSVCQLRNCPSVFCLSVSPMSLLNGFGPKTFIYCPLDRYIEPSSNYCYSYSCRRRSRDIFIERRWRGGQCRKTGQQIGFDVGERTSAQSQPVCVCVWSLCLNQNILQAQAPKTFFCLFNDLWEHRNMQEQKKKQLNSSISPYPWIFIW